jgi:hypothetical protein
LTNPLGTAAVAPANEALVQDSGFWAAVWKSMLARRAGLQSGGALRQRKRAAVPVVVTAKLAGTTVPIFNLIEALARVRRRKIIHIWVSNRCLAGLGSGIGDGGIRSRCLDRRETIL